MKNIFNYTLVLLLLAGIFATGCENILEPSVDQEKLTEEAIETQDDLQAFVYGAHDILNRTALFGRDFYVSPEVMSDNAWSNENSGRFVNQRDFNFPVTHGYPALAWSNFYQAISNANIVINSGFEGGAQTDHIIGQAYALRAFSHMNLLLAFGQQYVDGGDAAHGVPYVTTYNEGELYPPRAPIATVWDNIGADFQTAVNMMDSSFDSDVSTISYYAVRALQSRFNLYTEDFDAAIAAADEVINSGEFVLVPAGSFVDSWAAGTGPSSIFELAFTDTDRLGTDNIARILRDSNYGDVEITQDLYDAYSEDDVRRDLITADLDNDRYRMTNKYVDELGTDNVRLVRYAEVLLNKAEALSRRNQGTDRIEALTIINDLSAERGNGIATYTEGSLENVLAERRLELAMEGHRLYDLARNGLDIPNPATPAGFVRFNDGDDLPFGDYRYALPIPNAEMNANPNMVQNSGYN